MIERNQGLTSDPLFVGATRPPMRWGVTFAALLCNMMFTIAQVASTYGAGDAQTIIENCGNTLILRCSGSDSGGTAHFASRLIGDRELLRHQISRSRDREGLFATCGPRRSTQTTVQQVTEAAILPSQLEQLPDLAGYLKTASARRWRRITLVY
jgi:type IV secretory pathway TraG/TraD family ATPase VirD4